MKNIIYELNGVKVVLDSDLALLYGTQTKRINERVNRNKDSFSSDITWVLTDEQKEYLWSQNATANISKKSRSNPRVFTKDGVIILSSIMKSNNLKETTDELLGLFDKNDLTPLFPGNIRDLVYDVNGKQVMLDSDLAFLYHVDTKRINEAVKNNPNKFPNRFSFVLTIEEKENLWSKFSTANISTKSRVSPRVFTEQGIYMLATILKSKVATTVTIKIMDTFIAMREYIANSLIEQKLINDMVLEDNKRINNLERIIKEKTNYIFFDGERYDSYSLMRDIFTKSKNEIVIIDNYLDKMLLDVLRSTDKIVRIITNKYNKEDYIKYCSQYSNIELLIRNDIHDRFIIIDRKELYHCGASFKDLGNKCFEINKVTDKEELNKLIKKFLN